MTNAIKTHEQYTIVEGNFMLVLSIDTTSEKPRITLSKPDSFNNAKARDYHFEQSNIEMVEGFAKCALKAVEIAKAHIKPEPAKPKQPKKRV